MKSDRLLDVFRRSADPLVAMRAPGPDCPSDGEMSSFAAGQTPDEAADILGHLMDCERCRNLARLLRSDAPPAPWAVAATRRATRRWARELERQATYTLRFMPAGSGLDFVAVAAAPRADLCPARLRLEKPKHRVSLHLRQGDEPLAGVEVALVEDNVEERRTGRTDARGLVSFLDLPAGEYAVAAPELDQPMTLRRGEPD